MIKVRWPHRGAGGLAANLAPSRELAPNTEDKKTDIYWSRIIEKIRSRGDLTLAKERRYRPYNTIT